MFDIFIKNILKRKRICAGGKKKKKKKRVDVMMDKN
jgi:hypothetical protein